MHSWVPFQTQSARGANLEGSCVSQGESTLGAPQGVKSFDADDLTRAHTSKPLLES